MKLFLNKNSSYLKEPKRLFPSPAVILTLSRYAYDDNRSYSISLYFPGRYYYDPALFAEEQEKIFSTMWFYVCRADMLPHSGAYQVVTVGRESIIIVRDKDSKLHAFLNVCRHRGSRLCSQHSGQLKGSIQCRYHAWTYGLDGQLIGAPNVLNDERFDRSAYGLLPVALHIWEGLVFLNLADGSSALRRAIE